RGDLPGAFPSPPRPPRPRRRDRRGAGGSDPPRGGPRGRGPVLSGGGGAPATGATTRLAGAGGAVRASLAPTRVRLAPDERHPGAGARGARVLGDGDRADRLGTLDEE